MMLSAALPLDKAWQKQEPEVVMLRLRPKARSQAKPAVEKPGQAKPSKRLGMAFGPAQVIVKPEPGA